MSTPGGPLAFVLSHDVTIPELLTVAQFERERASLSNQISVFERVAVVSRDRHDSGVSLSVLGVEHTRSRWLYRFPRLYAWLAPLVFAGVFRRTCGAYYHHYVAAFGAPLARWLWGSRYLLSCNWMKSEVIGRQGYWLRAALHRRLEGAIFRNAELVTVGSPHLEAAVRLRAGTRVEVRPRVHYIDPEKFSEKPSYAASRPFRVAAVGRLVPIKDYPLMIEAVAALPGVELVIHGRGALEGRLAALAQTRGARVQLPGYVPNDQLAARLHGCDAYLMTSHYEGTPKGLMEAMACGLPCVARDLPAFRDLLGEDRGLLGPGDAASVTEAIAKLQGDASRREALGRRARQHILLHHSREVSERQEREALLRFRQILTERGGRR